MTKTSIRWNSAITFIFSTSAAAIGLGNIWRFPYMVGQHGGATFVLLYLLCIVILGIPLLLAEVTIGRLGRGTPPEAMRSLAQSSNRSPAWRWAGVFAILTVFLILSYYVVITGWVVDYFFKAIFNQFHQLTNVQSFALFTQLQNHTGTMLLTDTICILLTALVVALGIKNGLEKMIIYLFPAMFILLIFLFIYACSVGDLHHTLRYLFSIEPSQLTFKTLLMAMSQAFFSLSIGMGANVMMSAYLPRQVGLLSATIWITIADTAFALLAGLIIFPLVFAYHLPTSAGPSLIFQTLPLAFGSMKFGGVFGTLFFILLFFAAFSSVVVIFETVSTSAQKMTDLSRKQCLTYTTVVWWFLSLLSIGSFTHPEVFRLFGMTFFNIIDYYTAAFMLPVSGLLFAIFVGWLLRHSLLKTEVNWNIDGFWYKLWRLILCFLAPVAIVLIIISGYH